MGRASVLVLLPLLVLLGTARAGASELASTSPLALYASSGEARGERDLSAADLMAARGFIGESYALSSRDGTLLTMHHLVNPLADQRALNRFPVLITHGLGGDALQMISNSERSRPRRPTIGKLSFGAGDLSLPFMLANNNFDVYMLDARGTNLNNRRASSDFDPLEMNRFWNYTLDEQAQLDLPAAVDFVLAQTGAAKLHFIGYSESTLFMLALLAAQPHYQLKLASAALIAPVAYLTHARGLLLSALVAASAAPDQLNANSVPLPLGQTLGLTLRQVCALKLTGATVCKLLTDTFTGSSSSSADPSSFIALGFFKSTSLKSLKHFYQLHTQRRFGMYDYGPAANLRHYGQQQPPSYDLSLVRLPTLMLVRGGKDFLSTPEDQLLLLRLLGVKPMLDIQVPGYNHLDFFTAPQSLQQVNVPIVQAMLNILQASAAGTQSIFRDATREPKPVKPMLVRTPNQSRQIEQVQSNLLPNLLTGLAGTGFVPMAERLNDLSSRPMQILDGLGGQMKDLGLPILPTGAVIQSLPILG